MGKTGSGKSTVGEILALKTGFELYEIGHEVKKVYLERVEVDTNLLSEKDYSTTNQRLKYTDDIVKKYGNDYYVKRILERRKNEDIIIVGPRSIAEINAIKNKIHFPFFVSFTCSGETIKRRFIKRESEFMSLEEAQKIFEERTLREEQWGAESVLNQSNIILQTDDTDPIGLANIIIDRYNEFVKQQLSFENRILEVDEGSR